MTFEEKRDELRRLANQLQDEEGRSRELAIEILERRAELGLSQRYFNPDNLLHWVGTVQALRVAVLLEAERLEGSQEPAHG